MPIQAAAVSSLSFSADSSVGIKARVKSNGYVKYRQGYEFFVVPREEACVHEAKTNNCLHLTGV